MKSNDVKNSIFFKGISFFSCILFFSCNTLPYVNELHNFNYSKFFTQYSNYKATILEFPVGSAMGDGYYIAQRFGEKNPKYSNYFHLGEDWNHLSGKDSDLDAPVFAIGNGVVVYSKDLGKNWGYVVAIVHKLEKNHITDSEYIESLYAHLRFPNIKVGEAVRRSQLIGYIGNAYGSYSSHLHFELRENPNLPVGGGYSDTLEGFLDPSSFIKTYNKK